jgi:hypothetical protein
MRSSSANTRTLAAGFFILYSAVSSSSSFTRLFVALGGVTVAGMVTGDDNADDDREAAWSYIQNN